MSKPDGPVSSRGELKFLLLYGDTGPMNSMENSSMIISGLTAYIDRTFDEALALAREVRDYLRNYGEEESQKIAIDIAAHYSVEIMCQTSRLTNMLAWLLVPRAIHQGALSHEEVRKDNWRPGGSDVCLKESAIDPERLPPYLCDLLRRSERL